MSQHDMVISDAPGATVRSDLNDALQAIASTHSGTSQPTTIYSGQMWIDTNTPSSSVWTQNVYDGSDNIKVGEIDTSNNTYSPELLSGAVVQSATGAFVTHQAFNGSSGSNAIPVDDTIPAISEGTQITSAAITPKSSSNKLRVRVSGIGTLTAAGAMVAAVFRDAGTDAIGMGFTTVLNANNTLPVTLETQVDASTTASTTFSLRVGPSGTMTMYTNGSTSARIGGGVAEWRLVVEEIKG